VLQDETKNLINNLPELVQRRSLSQDSRVNLTVTECDQHCNKISGDVSSKITLQLVMERQKLDVEP
jgi:hypothetical protein